MVLVTLVLLAAQSAAPAATPTPTPTPAPQPPALKILLGKRAAEPTGKRSSLEEVAKHIKLRLPAGRASHTITNETVTELAQGVELTTAVPSSGVAVPSGAEGSEHGGQGKDYWRREYQDARAELAYWKGETKRLDGEVHRLERQFYAEDDPAYRDGVIKPAWDKALVDWRHAKAEVQRTMNLPDQILERARRDGALPGWFRGLPEPAPKLPPERTPQEPPLPQ